MITGRMRSKGLQAVLVSFLLVLSVLSFGGTAFSFHDILSFGDSLTDNYVGPTGYDNLYDSYGLGRYTDGAEVWVEYLADDLNLPLYDMAFGGATTAYDDPAANNSPIYGLQWQVDTFLSLYAKDTRNLTNNTLVVVWAGANDFLQNRSPIDAANNVALAITKLADNKFKRFLVINVPDIGMTPAFMYLNTLYPGIAAGATQWCQIFNTALQTNVNTLRNQKIMNGKTIYWFDAFEMIHEVVVDPAEYLKYGVTSYQGWFWTDGFHPSGAAHLAISDFVYEVVNKKNK